MKSFKTILLSVLHQFEKNHSKCAHEANNNDSKDISVDLNSHEERNKEDNVNEKNVNVEPYHEPVEDHNIVAGMTKYTEIAYNNASIQTNSMSKV